MNRSTGKRERKRRIASWQVMRTKWQCAKKEKINKFHPPKNVSQTHKRFDIIHDEADCKHPCIRLLTWEMLYATSIFFLLFSIAFSIVCKYSAQIQRYGERRTKRARKNATKMKIHFTFINDEFDFQNKPFIAHEYFHFNVLSWTNVCVFCLCQPICLHMFSSISVYYFYVWCNIQDTKENAYVIFAVEIFLVFWICSNKSNTNLLKPGENWSTVCYRKMKMLEMNIDQINYPHTMVSTQAGVIVLMPAEPCLLYRFANQHHVTQRSNLSGLKNV